MVREHARSLTPVSNPADRLEFLSRHRVFGALPPAILANVADEVIERAFPRWHRLFDAADPVPYVYLLRSGLAAIIAEDVEGNSRVVQIFRPGDLLGLGGALRGIPWGRTGTAIVDSRALLLKVASFRELYRGFPEFAHAVTLELSRLIGRSHDYTYRLTMCPLPDRVAALLLEWVESEDTSASPPPYPIRLSHGELAFLLGVSRETVTRVLDRLSRDGLVSLQRRRLSVLRPDALRAVADQHGAASRAVSDPLDWHDP